MACQRSSCTEAQIEQRYGDIPNRSDAGVFKVRISLVWPQFLLEQDKVSGRRVGVVCLVNFLDSPTAQLVEHWAAKREVVSSINLSFNEQQVFRRWATKKTKLVAQRAN